MCFSGDIEPKTVRIRRPNPDERSRVFDLIQASFGRNAILADAAFWNWKHADSPFGPSFTIIAEEDGMLVGLRVFMKWTWCSEGVEASAVRAVDTATHPSYRGRGIFRRLTEQLRDEVGAEGTAFVFNTPNKKSRPGYLKMGWMQVGRPTLWIRAVRPIRLGQAVWRKGLSGQEDAPPAIEAPPVEDILCRPGVVELVEAAKVSSSFRFHTCLSMDYLRWRYVHVPSVTYQAVSQGEGLDGAILIIRSRKRGLHRELRLCDVIVGPTSAASRNFRALLISAPTLAEVDVVISMAGGRPSFKFALLSSGFIPIPWAGPILTAYYFKTVCDVPDPFRMSNWGASIGDLELF